MRSLIFFIVGMIAINANAQQMEIIKETVTRLFVATDNHEWNEVEDIFADQVELDYSSMTGNPAVQLSPAEIVGSWKGILPGFSYTHHQLGNYITSIDGSIAIVFCYGTATHYLENEDGNVWTVVGSYDFELIQQGKSWKIKKMKFNYKYQDGNTSLPALAMEKLK